MRSPRAWLFVSLVGLTLAAGGCSSSSGGAAAPPPSAAAPTTQAATTQAATTPAAPTPSADTVGNSDDDNLASRICTALSPATAKLQMASASPGEAVKELKQTVAKVYAPGEAVLSGGDLDARTKKTCPDLRDEVLLTIGKSSVADLA